MQVKSNLKFSPIELTIQIETEEELKVLTAMFGRDFKIPAILRDCGDINTKEESALNKIMTTIYNEVAR